MITKIIICIVIPLLFFSIIQKKDGRHITLFLCLGTLICLLAYTMNSWIMANTSCSYFYLTTTISPIIEELLKFIPILHVTFFTMFEKEDILPIAFAVGIGFAITENMYMLIENADDASIEWVILRGISAGLMHAMSSSIIALGVLKAKDYPGLYYIGIIASMFLSMIYHGFYNCLIYNNGIMRYIGVAVPLLTFAVIFLIYKKEVIKAFLAE